MTRGYMLGSGFWDFPEFFLLKLTGPCLQRARQLQVQLITPANKVNAHPGWYPTFCRDSKEAKNRIYS